MFFFEKKNQKTFVNCAFEQPRRPGGWCGPKQIKVFWFFFSKKNALLSSACLSSPD
jgi:hypothetical protein